MGTLVSDGDFWVIRGHMSDKVKQEFDGMVEAHHVIMNYIIDSAKQMADFVQSNVNDSRVLRTPSRQRRTSKRKRSSMRPALTTTKKSALKTSTLLNQSVTTTPRRLSKRAKRSTIKLDTTVEEMDTTEPVLNSKQPALDVTDGCTTKRTPAVCEPIDRMSVEVFDVDVEVESKSKKTMDNLLPRVMINRLTPEQTAQHMAVPLRSGATPVAKVLTADEMMSELSIADDVVMVENEMVANDREEAEDNDWMTDDEDSTPTNNNKKPETEEFFDAMDAKHELRAQSSAFKKKKTTTTGGNQSVRKERPPKKSLYFTPQTTQRSTRAQTRMQSRIADTSGTSSGLKTPQIGSRIVSRKDSTAGAAGSSRTMGSTIPATGGSSARAVRSHSRVRSAAESKALTDSALKKRQEADDERRQRLLASQEKEKRAVEKRRILIEQSVTEKKMKSQEKAMRAAELREANKLRETERLLREQQKREEWERKREEERRELLRRKQEEVFAKQREVERRRRDMETKELEAKQRREYELQRKHDAERERQREQERMAALIQHHNNSLQQKAMANSYIKKCEPTATVTTATSAAYMPRVVVSKLSPELTAQHTTVPTTTSSSNLLKVLDNESMTHKPDPNSTYTKPVANETFSMDREVEVTSSYDMTPPPKEHDYDNYDISQIASDDDTDDESQPRKRIPGWARGQAFIKQVHRQYSKPYKQVYRDVKEVFGSGDVLLEAFKTDFDLMFPKKPLHPKYQKRTSSAVWDDPPARYRTANESINESFL